MMTRFLWKYVPGPPVQSTFLDVNGCFLSICPRVQMQGADLMGSDLDIASFDSFIEMLDRGPCHAALRRL